MLMEMNMTMKDKLKSSQLYTSPYWCVVMTGSCWPLLDLEARRRDLPPTNRHTHIHTHTEGSHPEIMFPEEEATRQDN